MYIKCMECGKELKKITHTHLWKHQMTIEEYIHKYPDAPLENTKMIKNKSAITKGKTYEERYGHRTAFKLRKRRSEDAKIQMENEEQRKIRSEKCGGYERTEKGINKMKEKKTKEYIHYRQKALDYYGEECQRCGETDDLIVHHIDHQNIRSDIGNHSLDNLMVLCKSCHSKIHSIGGKWTGIPDVEKGVHYILKGLQKEYGLDLKDPNFKDTPKRIARAYAEIFEGINCEEQVKEILTSTFPSNYNGIIIAEGINCFSVCPHHLLPVEYIVNLGYMPGKYVLGLSKLTRIVELMAKAPKLQEDFTSDVISLLEKYLEPKGAIIQVKGKHYCMAMRGVKQKIWTHTSSICGVFDQQSLKDEFQMMLNIRVA